jgi:hypothetical protein
MLRSSRLPIHALRASLSTAAIVSAFLMTGCTATSSEDAFSDTESVGDVESGAGTTVSQAVANSCTTSSVKGLSKQIIAEARCINAESFVAVPDLGNVSFGTPVFPYLEKPAKERLVKALNAKPGTSMSVNSMLRTVAQQYLLYRWYQNGTCGIGLAAKPGSSNHETGLAIDISQYSTWKATLQAHGFAWLGSSDPVHFDYAGAGAVSYKGLDVKAFQRLWNRNHPGDKIDTDGVWGPQTEARMKKSPAGGFATGATCASAQSFESDAELSAADEDGLFAGEQLAVADAISAVAEGDDMAGGDLTASAGGQLLDDHDHELHASTGETSAADETCSSCFHAICQADPYCCETEWDDSCVTRGLALCETLCGPDAN